MQIPPFVCDSPVEEQSLPSLRIRGAGAHPDQAQSFPRTQQCSAGESKAFAASAICENWGSGAVSCALSCALLLLRSPSQPCCRAEGPHRGPPEQPRARDPPAGLSQPSWAAPPGCLCQLCPGWGCQGQQGWAEQPGHTCLTWNSLSPAGAEAAAPGSPPPLSPAVDVTDVDPALGKSNPRVLLGQGVGWTQVGSGRGAGGEHQGLKNCMKNY